MANPLELATFPPDAKRPTAIDELAVAIESDGGAALAAYQEPIGSHWQLFALLPAAMLRGTPFQRDLSSAHVKRLGEVMKKLRRFTEPVVAVRADGAYWTPNGVYAPLLSRVDGFLIKPLCEAIEEREERAALVSRADDVLTALVARGKKRGLVHPYLKNYIAARCNPLSRARKSLPTCGTALNTFIKALEDFDLGKIHFGQIQSAAALVAAASIEPQ